MEIVGFLRGINVGGHHKVPMIELRDKLAELGCKEVKTLLNSGNVVFETNQTNIQELESKIEAHLTQSFNFPIPVILRNKIEIADLVHQNPFDKINFHQDIRLYVSFLKEETKVEIPLPYYSQDKCYQIISNNYRIICSVLDLAGSKTTKGMGELEKLFGKNITTRNWNTILKINDI